MDVRQLECFIALADELNFTRAAARCQVVQSALSYQIARLEQEQGIVLFHRTSRKVGLTPAGELLLPRARLIVAGVEDARNELADLAGLVTGQLRVGRAGGEYSATARFERTLADFHQIHPGVQITVDDTDSQHLTDSVGAGGLDVAVVDLSAEQVGVDLVYHPLAAEPLVAISQTIAAVLPSTMPPISLADLARWGSMIDVNPHWGLRRQIDLAFHLAGVARLITLEVSDPATVVRFVGMGFGSALVPLSATDGSTNVTVMPITEPEARYSTGLIHRRPGTCTPAARSFIKMLALADLVRLDAD